MIRIENLSKNYDTVQAVKSISFSLKDGEIVGFLGANGAGKSTTLKMMTGYLTPTGNELKKELDLLELSDLQEMVKKGDYKYSEEDLSSPGQFLIYSFPFDPKNSPILSFNSVGKGPSPTLVVYTLVIPKT